MNLLTLLAFIVGLRGAAPPNRAGADAAPPRPEAARSDPAARYTIGPQDQLKITVFDEPDLTNGYRVDSDGFITFPYIGRVAAAG